MNTRIANGTGIIVPFVSVLKWCFYTLSLMSTDGIPTMFYLTDAVNCHLDFGIYGGLVMQLCRADIQVNVINLTEEFDADGVQFGFLPDPSALKSLSKMTGGYFMGKNTEKSISEILARVTCFTRDFNLGLVKKESIRDSLRIVNEKNRHKYEVYEITIPVDITINCRLREGFKFISTNDTEIAMILDCHYNCFIEYKINILESSCWVEVWILCRDRLFQNINKEMQALNIFTKDAKPSVPSRVSWFVKNIRDSEEVAMHLYTTLFQTTMNSDTIDKIVSIPLYKWHQWFEIEKIEVITTNEYNDISIRISRTTLIETIRKMGNPQYFKNNIYLELFEKNLLLAQITWNGHVKATVYLGFFGQNGRLYKEKIRDLIEALRETQGFYIFSRPVNGILVENLKYNSNPLRIYSIFTFRPVDQAIKAFMFKISRKWQFLSKKSAEQMEKILFELKINLGFIYLGETENGGKLLIKPLENDTSYSTTHCFIQNLMRLSNNTLLNEIYIEPGTAGLNRMPEDNVIEEIKDEYESYDHFLYNALTAFDYLMYKSLQKKLRDDDLDEAESDEEYEESIIEIVEEDNVFCYYTREKHQDLQDFEEIKLEIYSSMYAVFSQYDNLEVRPRVKDLLRCSTKHSHELDIYGLYNPQSMESWRNSLGILYRNMLTGFSRLSDYYLISKLSHCFVRFLSGDLLLIWTLPSCNEFIEKCIDTRNYVHLQLYECSSLTIDPSRFIPQRKEFRMKLSDSESAIWLKTLSLLDSVYKSIYNTTFYQCLLAQNITLTENSIKVLLDSSDCISKVINYPLLNEITEISCIPAECCKKLIKSSLILSHEIFEEIEEKMNRIISEDFIEIYQGIYMLKDTQIKILLKIGDDFTKMSDIIYRDRLEFKIYLFENKCFFGEKWYRNLNCSLTEKKYEKQIFFLEKIYKEFKLILAEFIVEYIKFNVPLTELSFKAVNKYLPILKRTATVNYSISPIIPDKFATELLRQELIKSNVMNLLEVSNCYIIISTAHRKSFYLQTELEEEEYVTCAPATSIPKEYYIPFWLIIETLNSTSISAKFFLPPCLEYEQLTTETITSQLISWFTTIEKRINQRILLSNLVETGNLSELLIPSATAHTQIDPEHGQRRGKQRQSRRGLSIASPMKAVSAKESPFTLKSQHTRDFAVFERSKNVGKFELIAKFALAPFIIYNREDVFKFEHHSEIHIFHFVSESNRKEDLLDLNTREKSNLLGNIIHFEIFGIDPPQYETIKKLEQSIQETLEQADLLSLADSLTKNQKNVITSNHVEFIHGTNSPERIYFKIGELIHDPFFFSVYLKQNLRRFLTTVTYEGTSMLLYNYMTVVGSNSPTQSTYFPPRLKEETATYLGNTYGKALAFIYIDITYFDGETIISGKKTPEYTNNGLLGERWPLPLTNPIGSAHPVTPGHHLEITVYEKGHLNKIMFFNRLETCVHETTTEYLLELFFSEFSNLTEDPFLVYTAITNYCKMMINQAMGGPSPQIIHYAPAFTLYRFFETCVSIIEEALQKGTVVHYLCLEEQSECRILTEDIGELKLLWEKEYNRENSVGREVRLSAMWGADFLFNLTRKATPAPLKELKLYPTIETHNANRSFFIYLEVLPTTIEFYTYNISRTVLDCIHQKLQIHVNWTLERSKFLSKLLTQKLGLNPSKMSFYTNNEDTNPNDKFQKLLHRSCNKLRITQTHSSFSFDSLTDSYEKEHRISHDYIAQSLKFQGLYPLVKNQIVLRPSKDKVSQHGQLLRSMIDVKTNLYSQCHSIALAYRKWCPQSLATLTSTANKILLKNSYTKMNEGVLAKTLLKYASLIHHDKSLYYFKTVSPDDLDNNRSKFKQTVSMVMKAYATDLKKTLRFDIIMNEEQSLSVRKFSTDPSSESIKFQRNTLSFPDPEKSHIEFTKIYLKKVFEQTILILEISSNQETLSISAYCIEHLSQYVRVNEWEDHISSKNARKEIFKILNGVKITSFMYDAHIKHLAFYLCKPLFYPAIDVLATLNSLFTTFKKQPSGCQNWIYSGQAVLDLGELEATTSEEIYSYFYWNCTEYGFKNLPHSTTVFAIVFPHQDLERQENIDEILIKVKELTAIRGFVYTSVDFSIKGRLPPPVLLKSEKSNNKLRIRYYVLNYEKMKKKNTQNTVKFAKQMAEGMLVEAIRKSKEDHKLDRLWDRLKDPESKHYMQFKEFTELLATSHTEELSSIDSKATYITSLRSVFDQQCLDYLEEAYQPSKRFISEETDHLIVFYEPTMFAHLFLGLTEQVLSIHLVHRSQRYVEDSEDAFVSDLLSNILQWLWSRLTMADSLCEAQAD